jgi:hypothetical protein
MSSEVETLLRAKAGMVGETSTALGIVPRLRSGETEIGAINSVMQKSR